jgi:polar amino acid transport system substrate-binding protein
MRHLSATRTIRNLALGAGAALAVGGLAACGDDQGGTGGGQASTLAQVQKADTLRAGIRFDNPPHSFIGKNGAWQGFDIDIAEALAKQMGVKLEKVKVDELTRISYLDANKIDVAVASMSHTVERDKQVDFSDTYFRSKQTFLVKKGQVDSLEDLVGKRVGMDRGSSAIGNWQDWLKANGKDPNAQISEFSEKQAAVQAVKSGRIAGFAEDYEILASFAKGDPSLQVLGGEGIGLKLDGIGVKEDDSKMRDAVNFGLHQLVASGDYQRIYDRWFGPKSETPVPLERDVEVWPNG